MDPVDYQKRNDAFKPTLVFHLGAEAGFFSEFNNMVLAMLYCLRHEIRFVLYSDNANFKVSRGWEDFFLPFCEETRRPEHREFNRRLPPDRIAPEERERIDAFKKSNGIAFLTHELWNRFRSSDFERQSFSLSNRHGLDLQSAAGVLVSMLWRYNVPIHASVEAMRRRVSLPGDYLGIHVRAGDKAVEAPLKDISHYMDRAKTHSSLRDVFLSTDDYAVVEEACRRYPGYSFRTLCTPSERGYVHQDFMRQHARVRQWRLLNFFSAIEILASARYFFGSISTNPGMYLGMRMGGDRAFFIDSDHWRIW
jgi:hypothetical protein